MSKRSSIIHLILATQFFFVNICRSIRNLFVFLFHIYITISLNTIQVYGRSRLYNEWFQCDILLYKSTVPLSSKIIFCTKFAQKICTLNPKGKCVFPKWQPNEICICRVNKTIFCLFQGKVRCHLQSQHSVGFKVTLSLLKSTVLLGWIPQLEAFA